MKINNKIVTPNELAKIAILEQLQNTLFDGLSSTSWILDNEKFTDKDEQLVFIQLTKKMNSIRKLLLADNLNTKFDLNL